MKYDMVCEGGGVKGIAFIGAMAALEEEGFHPSHAAGTSSGAIFTAARIAGYSPREIFDIIHDMDLRKFKDTGYPIDGRGINLLFRLGVYRGDYFYNFIKEILEAKGIRTFGDLRSDDPLDDDPKFKYRFRCYASDITKGRLVTMPNDLPHLYNEDPDEFEVARAIRCSMSIPIFYKPMKINNSHIVDGGLISNFPINAFDTNEPPLWPTFGLLLNEDHNASTDRITYKLHIFILSILKTMLGAHDKLLIEPLEYMHRTIKIPVGNYQSTQFNVSNEDKHWLYSSGYDTTKLFLSHWTWRKYRAWASGLRSKFVDKEELWKELEPHVTEKSRDIVIALQEEGLSEEAAFNLIRFKIREVFNGRFNS